MAHHAFLAARAGLGTGRYRGSAIDFLLSLPLLCLGKRKGGRFRS
jgi:hypothetical protein